MKLFFKAIAYNRATGATRGNVQSHDFEIAGGKTRVTQGETFHLPKIKAKVGIIPHGIRRQIAPVQGIARQTGLRIRSGATLNNGHATIEHHVQSSTRTGADTAEALHARFRAMPHMKMGAVVSHSGIHTFEMIHKPTGTVHRFTVHENPHVQGIHQAFRSIGGIRAKTTQPKEKVLRYRHEVITAAPARQTAQRLKAVLAPTHRVTSTTRDGVTTLKATHVQTGVEHHFTLRSTSPSKQASSTGWNLQTPSNGKTRSPLRFPGSTLQSTSNRGHKIAAGG